MRNTPPYLGPPPTGADEGVGVGAAVGVVADALVAVAAGVPRGALVAGCGGVAVAAVLQAADRRARTPSNGPILVDSIRASWTASGMRRVYIIGSLLSTDLG